MEATIAVVVALTIAVGTAALTMRTERTRQLRDRRLIMAGDFAEAVSAALAELRHYKPTTQAGHRNDVLHHDDAARKSRAALAAAAVDKARALRGPVWVAFPGRSDVFAGPITASDFAELSIAELRFTEEVCGRFWSSVRNGQDRSALEARANTDYAKHKEAAWRSLDRFADVADAEIRSWRTTPIHKPARRVPHDR